MDLDAGNPRLARDRQMPTEPNADHVLTMGHDAPGNVFFIDVLRLGHGLIQRFGRICKLSADCLTDSVFLPRSDCYSHTSARGTRGSI